MSDSAKKPSLSDLRREIDGIDAELMALFERRLLYVEQIGAIKRQEAKPIEDKAREKQILAQKMKLLETESYKRMPNSSLILFYSFKGVAARYAELLPYRNAPKR